jgi:hypothetical protein
MRHVPQCPTWTFCLLLCLQVYGTYSSSARLRPRRHKRVCARQSQSSRRVWQEKAHSAARVWIWVLGFQAYQPYNKKTPVNPTNWPPSTSIWAGCTLNFPAYLRALFWAGPPGWAVCLAAPQRAPPQTPAQQRGRRNPGPAAGAPPAAPAPQRP